LDINLRQLGIAARFVSGYYYFDMDEQLTNYMRGWTFSGIGWLGLDPSHGILTVNTHSNCFAHFENTMPFGIRGSATSKLLTQLSIEKQK
jgi:hypothetical protein